MTLIDPSSEPVIRFLEANNFGKELQALRLEGSARKYFRVTNQDSVSAVLCIEEPFIAENHDFLTVRDQLASANVPVPSILALSARDGLILQSDAGSSDLESWKSASHRTESEIESQYITLVDSILAMQSLELNDPVASRAFDREKLYWEMEFLFERLERLRNEKGIDVVPSFELMMFLLEACEALGQYSADCFVHRDLHSRNVMMKDDSQTIIDFQDARSGNRYYDLASLLFDPYTEISQQLRKACLDHYFEKAGLEKGRGLFYLQGLQRVLKALGSYLYLGLELNKTTYLECVEGALTQLEAALHLGRFPDSVFLFILDCKRKLVPALK